MTFTLSAASRAQLVGVHPRLVAVVERAIVLTAQDFAVHDGVRTTAEQAALVKAGASKTLHSKHLPQADGYGHAVDLVPYIGRTLRWEWEPLYRVALAMRQAAQEIGVAITWGGCWDTDLRATEGTLEAVRAGYVVRRGRGAFLDGPHFEMR